MNNKYWLRQNDKPLFPDLEWSKPEQRAKAGKLGIIGGNKLGFASVAESYQTALTTGAGEVKILLPDALKKAVPKSITDAVFAASNQSGSLSGESYEQLRSLGDWAEGILLIGDAGRNSETAIVYEKFLEKYTGQLTITRDAIDLLKSNPIALVERPDTSLIMSFAQLQKLFQTTYYPIVLTFSMQLSNLVEALHKFTITYPVTITVFHQDNILVARDGTVMTMPWTDPMLIWRGDVATKAASYWLWSPKKSLEAISTSLINQTQ